jgi:hypothetical protein
MDLFIDHNQTIKTIGIACLFLLYGIMFTCYEIYYSQKYIIYYLLYPLTVWIFDMMSGMTLMFILGPRNDEADRPDINEADRNAQHGMITDKFHFVWQSIIIGLLLFVRGLNRYYRFI